MSKTPASTEEQPVATPETTRRTGAGSQIALMLGQASHPRQALLTAVGLAVAAALSGRPAREVGLVLATVLLGQVVLGWFDDLTDRERDARLGTERKPIAQGLVDPGNARFLLVCAVLLVVPLALSNSFVAGGFYLVSLLFGTVVNRQLKDGPLSPVPWLVSFALYPFFLSYGGWGGQDAGGPPAVAMVVLAALLGLGVHVLTSLPGLVGDDSEGVRSLPLRLGLRMGASRLLVLAGLYTGVVCVLLTLAGLAVGLRS